MKESNNLNKTEPDLSSEKEVTPSEEKAILSSLQMESSSFVPDKLQDIMKATKAETAPLDEKEQEEIVAALEGESQAFVPNDLTAVQKATGTYNPYYSQEDLAVKEKVKNEGAEVVPDVENDVYAATGAKKHFSFKKHWIAWASGTLVAAASIATIVVLSNKTVTSLASGTYVSVTMQPASSVSLGTTLLPAYSTNSVNTNCPSWSFLADQSNYVSTLSPDNYSAKLVDYSLSGKTLATSVTSDLVSHSYNKGYLETIDPTLRNKIVIDVYSTNANYESVYGDQFKTAIDASLTSNHIYADVTFNVVNISSELSDVKDGEAQDIIDVYNSFSEAVTLKELQRNYDNGIVPALHAILKSAGTAKLSPLALKAFKEGLFLSYQAYEKQDSPKITSAEASDLRDSLIANPGLPWANYENQSWVIAGLKKDAYYVIGDSIAGNDTDHRFHWPEFAELRSYLLTTRETNAKNYLTFLSEVQTLADLSQDATGYIADGYNNAHPDDGQHNHGDGPNNHEGWGDGGGDWHDGPGMPGM
jgi:hypothetical protein